MNDREEFEQAVRSVIAKDAITERLANHWSHLFPRIEDEQTLLTAALSGLYAPVELGVPRAAFTGHRYNLWAGIEHHYAQAEGFAAPDLERLAEWIGQNGVRGPVLEELVTLRDECPFQVEEYVLQAAARVGETHRARELAIRLERAAMMLHAGEPVAKVKEWLGIV